MASTKTPTSTTFSPTVSRWGKPKQDGKIVAFADVNVAPGITVRGFKVIKSTQLGQKYFLGVPSQKGQKPNTFFDIVQLSDEQKANIAKAVISGYEALNPQA